MSIETEDENGLTTKYTGQLADYTFWLTMATWMAALLSAIGVGISIWIAYSTNELKRVAANQLEEMRKSAEQVERSIKAANEQVAQMQTSNSLQESSQTKQLRAYLVLENYDLNDAFSKAMSFSYNIKNVGQTPAYKVTSYKCEDIVAAPADGDLESPVDFNVGADSVMRPESTVLGSGLSTTYRLTRSNCRNDSKEYSIQDINDFRRGAKVYVYWGIVYYRDIFLGDRYLRFCRYLKNGTLNTWYSCVDHNDAS
jgi:hypothetical protein